MKFNNETRAFGSIRKTKCWGTCGVILGLASLSLLSPVLADEITENKATNAPYAQTNPSSISTDNQGKSGQKQGALPIQVPHTELDSAVDKARDAGLVVVKENTVDKGIAETETDANAKLADIKQDYANQKEQIEKKVEEYKNQSKSENTNVERIRKENAEKQANYARELEKVEKENAVTSLENKAIEDENKRLTKEYEEAKANHSSTNVESIVGNKPLVDSKDGLSLYGGFDRTYATTTGYDGIPVETIKKFSTLTEEEFNKRLEALKEQWRSSYYNEVKIRQKLAGYAGSDWLSSELENLLGSDSAKFKDTIDKLKIKDAGGIKYYDFLLLNDKGKTHAETLTGSIRWKTDTKVEDIAGVADKFVNRAYKDPWKEGTGDNTLSTKFYDVHKGLTFKLANVGEFEDGSKLDLRFTVAEEPKIAAKFSSSGLNTDEDNATTREYRDFPTLTVGKSGNDDSLMFYYNNLPSLKFHVEFLKNGKKEKVALSTMISDVDWNQGSEFVFSDVTLKDQLYSPDEDKLTDSGSEGSYKRGLKIYEGHKVYDPFGDGIADDKAQAPMGTYLVSGYGDSFDYTYYARKSVLDGTYKDGDINYLNSSDFIHSNGGLQFNLFGSLAKGIVHSTVTAPKLKEIKPLKELPPTPLLTPVPDVISKPEIHYHYNSFGIRPNLEKFVKNSKGESINKSYVPKLSTVEWELTTKPLPANREAITDFEIVDALPSGFVLDVEASKKINSDFELTYDEASHVVRIKGLESLKSKLNQDLSKEVLVPAPILVGKVTNDGATYKNNFQLKINNKYESYSNIVQVSTPGKPNDPDNPNNNLIKPLKHNHNKDGVIIDGKTVLAGSTNYYHITLDYDQYKGIKADPSAILKGFGAIDDYPEEAVTTNQSDIRYIDSEGKEVSGISVYQYDSIDSVDNDKVKAFLASSEIKPKGAFQVFLVDDPEAYFNQYIKSGKSVTIMNPMVTKEELRNTGKSFENTAYQVDFGNGYQTDTVVNNVPTVKPGKKNLNKAGVNIGGKQVLAGSVNYYKVTADYSQYKGIEADKDRIGKGFYIVDDYPEEAVTINQDGVQVTDSKGQVVKGLKMALYESLAKAPSGVQEALKSSNFIPKGAIQVFEAENPEEFYKTYVQAGEVLTITNPMTVKKELGQTGGKYENTAYQLDFGSGYQTDKVENNVPTAKPGKKNLNKAGVNIGGKQVLAGSVNYYKVTADYSQYKGIEADKDRIGKGFYIVDDYPEEAVTINQDGVQVTDSKGQVVKGLKMALYESLAKAPSGVQEALKSSNFIPKGAIQVFEAENPEEFYKTYVQAGEVLTITNPMTVKKELGQTGGKYENTAYQLDFGSGYQTDKVENNVPTAKPGKKNLNKAGVNIGGKQVLAGSVNYYKVTADYSQYKGIEADKDRIGKGFYIVDDYPEEAVTINQDGVQVTDSKGQVVKGLKMALYESLAKAPSGVQEALKSSNFIPKGAIQVFEAENPEEFYKTYVQAGEVLTITNPMTVKKELGQTGGKYENTAYQLDFGSGYQTDKVENNVPTAKPGKKNLNKAGVNIGGKQVLAGSVNYYKVTADYSQYKGIEADKDRIGKGFYIVDDYPEEAVTINQDGVQVTDSKGQVVKGLKMALYESLAKAPSGVQEALKSSNFIPKGAIQVFEAENPEEFYKTYVQAGEVLTITNPMTVKKELGQTGGKYENTAYQLDFGSGYQTDKVENNVPTAKPGKKNLNKAGVNIGGKQVLAGSVNYYKVTADYSQYKGIEADKDRIGKGFYIVDDYPEEAVTINQDGVQVTDSKGQVVKGLKMALYESLAKAPSGVQEALKSSNFIPKGAIQVFEAENPEEFYKTYVQAGEVLTITNPMTVKKELGQTGGKYENTAYQVDFGMAYVTETVVNNVPKIEPKKDVVIDHLSKDSLDGKDIKLNQTFNYKLVGSLIPKDRSEQLFEYKFSDDYDETHDDYQSVYKVFATVDFETSDGQKFKAGDELTKFTSQVVDKAKGKVDISFDDTFLKSILETSEFQAEVYLQMTRIQSGTVENTYSHSVNGVEVVSNTVVTHTQEESKPQEPKKPSLPNTGTASSMLGFVGTGILSMLGLVGLKRKKD